MVNAQLRKLGKTAGLTLCGLLVVGAVAFVVAGLFGFWPFSGPMFEAFEGMTQDGDMIVNEQGNHDPHMAGEEDLILHNEEMKKLSEMEEMNALGCPGMLLSELDPASVNNKMNDYSLPSQQAVDQSMMHAAKQAMGGNQNMYNVPGAPPVTEGYAGPNMGAGNISPIKPGYLNGDSGMLNNTGLPGSEVKSSVGAEVTGFIGDNRQFPQFPQDQLDAEELLPKERSDQFAQLFPEGQGHLSNRRDFLTSGFHIGINTVGQTLRNANTQLRSDPPKTLG